MAGERLGLADTDRPGCLSAWLRTVLGWRLLVSESTCPGLTPAPAARPVPDISQWRLSVLAVRAECDTA